ncbi:MAG: WD40 repeat domain-containing protein, partial [Gemmataceae bacterium]|nr:WD40 repeat domain-containing protein [Gemmataceae bacterium]
MLIIGPARTLAAAVAAAATTAAPIPPPRPDALPDGATARLGTLAFRGWSLDGLAFSPDGRTLRAVRDWRRLAWDVVTGRPGPVRDFAPGGVGGLTGTTVFAGDRTVWVGSKGLVRPDHVGDNTVVVSGPAGREVCRFEFSGLTFPGYLETFAPVWMPKAAVTPDGKYLSVWVRGDKTLRTYDLDTGKPLFARGVEAKFDPGLHASPDGKTLYLHEPGGPIRRFALRTGEPLPDLAVPAASSFRVQAAPDGRRAVIRDRYVTSDDAGRYWSKPGHSRLTVWDLAANAADGVLPVVGTAVYFQFAGPDALLVLAANHRPGLPTAHTVSRWSVATRTRAWEVPVPPADWLAVSPDGTRFAVTDRGQAGTVYDAATGERRGPQVGHDGPVGWVGFSADGGTATTADRDTVWTWNRRGEGKAA